MKNQRSKTGTTAGLLLLGVALSVLPISITSCSAFPRTRTEVTLFRQDCLPNTWCVTSIETEGRSSYLPVASRLPEVLQSLAHGHGISILTECPELNSGPGTLGLKVWIREKEFVRNLESRSSITVMMSLHDVESGGEAARALYTEESGRTVESAYHLYAIVERLVGKLAREIRKATKSSE